MRDEWRDSAQESSFNYTRTCIASPARSPATSHRCVLTSGTNGRTLEIPHCGQDWLKNSSSCDLSEHSPARRGPDPTATRATPRASSLMMTKIFLSAAAVLALLSFAWPAQSVLHFLATLTICVAAIFAALQAGSEGRYYWLGGFVLLAL